VIESLDRSGCTEQELNRNSIGTELLSVIKTLAWVIGLSAVLTTSVAVADPRSSDAAAETYAQYSLMFERSGQDGADHSWSTLG
jgi:hypothetical protein